MNKHRRHLLKAGLAVGGTAAFVAGYGSTTKHLVEGAVTGSSGEKPKHAHFGNSLEPEYQINPQGKLISNPNQRVSPSMCLGCWTLCGVRVRIDNQTDSILRISGNPYHPLSQEHQIPFTMPLQQAYLSLTGDHGATDGRSTACARGNSMLELRNSPYRITQPLKRVGKRGEGQWQTISYEQLLQEIIEGGDLFGEGHVDGLRAIRDVETPLDSQNPEYGPKANQLLVTNASDEGRDDIIKRFTFNSFGTRNFSNHGAYCGFSFRAGSGALMNDLDKYAHVKPDIENVQFALFIGMSPAQAGNPFKRQARQLASARTRPDFEYVVVSPALPASSSLSAGDNNRWLPIKPGTDAALVMGMIRWIIENERFNKTFLSQPGEVAMAAAGTAHWSNATHLVICDEQHPRCGAFLRASQINLPYSGEAFSDGDSYVILDEQSHQPGLNTQPAPASLFVDTQLGTTSGTVRVKSSLQLLKEEALKYDLATYSRECEVPEEKIVELANCFTSYGTQAAVDTHGGTMHSNGFYTAYAILMLNALIGNLNMKGGVMAKAGRYPTDGKGPKYNFAQFPGKLAPKGVFISRNKFKYENTSEYQRKIAAGQSPYPSRAPWYPFSQPLMTEQLSAAIDGYPYRLKAWINHMSNPLYAIPGLNTLIGEKLKDPKQLPLIITIDPFISETGALSDYIVPDSVTYESWGMAAPWHGVPTKATTARWPIVNSLNAKTADGRSINMENLIIDIAKRLNLKGFGEKAIQDTQGNWHAINSAEDYYLRAAANLAFIDGGVPDASAEDIQLSGLERLLPEMQRILAPDELRKVAYVLARGGRFEDATESYQGDRMKHRWKKPLAIWNETLATSRNSMSGKRYTGCPTWYPQQLADGTPLHQSYPETEWPFMLTSFKSNIHSGISHLSPRLNSIKGLNPVYIHPIDAQRHAITTGDDFTITTPNNTIQATAIVVEGVRQGTLAVEHGFGHRELGAHAHIIDEKPQTASIQPIQGVNLNDLGLIDASREGKGILLDWVVGSAARQALPAKIG
ncbi:tetrathionate reductase subunit A [Pragia fontium]|uniref:Tetrathionate reductase subunit A n=1 Tax=Pragia fontium TaxID=82985 RepID=A0ABQ5LLG4_9GAMM|nr:tetrathionate reductase subunit A [Pragia fontium]GKX64470.1 tetrathionate reductase subunit A [Pragia fontium]VEJ56839.1 Formate dehydrogenase, nitrate-inducible, major subunit precursor [Pragia fontium]